MEPLRDFTRCSAVAIHVDDLKAGRAVVACKLGLDPEEARKYEQYYVTKNPWMLRSIPLCSKGQLMFGDQLISPRELKRTEYYSDWLRPNNIAQSMAVCLHQQPDLIAFFSLLRPPGAGGFEPRDIELVRLLIPHLQRAARASHVLNQHYAERSFTEYAFDALPCGAAVLDREAKALLINRAMKQILAREDGIMIRHLKLRFVPRFSQTTFESILIRNGPDAVGDVFRVMRASPRGDYEVVMSPIPVGHDSQPVFDVAADGACWLVLVTDPEQGTYGHLAALQRLYALSKAETEITSLLVEGKTLREISELRRTTINTVKSQVRAIYGKLDVTDRSALVRRITRLETGIRLAMSRSTRP